MLIMDWSFIRLNADKKKSIVSAKIQDFGGET
jgi:hypothetical protein